MIEQLLAAVSEAPEESPEGLAMVSEEVTHFVVHGIPHFLHSYEVYIVVILAIITPLIGDALHQALIRRARRIANLRESRATTLAPTHSAVPKFTVPSESDPYPNRFTVSVCQTCPGNPFSGFGYL